MKLIDFITEKKKEKVVFIAFSFKKKNLEKLLPDAVFVDWPDVSIKNGQIFIGSDNINAFSFIFLGLCGDNERKFILVKEYIEKSKTASLVYGSSLSMNNKLLQTFRFAESKLDQPKTVIGNASTLKASELVKDLGLPIISKILDGSQGRGVEKHTTRTALTKFLEDNAKKDFIFQEFIPNDGDIRAFFFKGELLFAIKRVAKTKGEFRNNVSLGGTQEFVELSEGAKKTAQKVNNVFSDLDFTGVDIIQHKTNKRWYVLEINSAPQFINKDDLVIPKIVDFIKKGT